MPSTTTFGVIAFVVVLTLLDLLVVRTLIRAAWDSLADRFPPRSVAADAIRRNFQTFAIDWVNLGHCVHAAADRAHLHLLPARFLRWFGCRPISIPWGEVAIQKRRRSVVTAKIGGATVKGPAWCLSLADPGSNGLKAEATPASPGEGPTGRHAPPHR
jgi:hypothetical protein